MKSNELEKFVDYFFKVAVQKCGDLDEAQDLCQETMLAAIKYLAYGKEINDIKSWLGAVMNRKFYDALRKKYKIPTVSIDSIIDIANETEFNSCINTDEAEELRKQIAFLSRIYREVIIRHYLNGENVESISNALSIPVGTVKSRLSGGRTQIKKGFDCMENFVKQSYEPQVLYVSISGMQGLNGEPYNITNNNLIAQNLLILAYDNPVTETELAKKIGIPAAYTESIIETLVYNELMKRIGNKVYTDFIIYSHDDVEKDIEPQKKLINNNFDTFWKPLQMGLYELRNKSFYVELSERKKRKLEYYFLMHTMSQCFFSAGSNIYDSKHDYPERPNGGKWIAMGHSYPQNYDFNNSEIHKYTWSGERTNEVYNSFGTKELTLKVFDTPLEKQRYFHTKFNLKDDVLAQMLYIINEGINPSDTGIDILYFENIPYLSECGVLNTDNGKPMADIPILKKEEYNELTKITKKAKDDFITSNLDLFSEHLKNAKAKIPLHLKSVPEQKQYLQSMSCLHMLVIFKAMEDKLIFNDVNSPCPPMILIVDK